MNEQQDPYFIDFPVRIKRIQAEMDRRGIDVYLGSRLRTLSWTLDVTDNAHVAMTAAGAGVRHPRRSPLLRTAYQVEFIYQ
jgi:hypothetical protein